MFGISFAELILAALLAVFLVKPADIPQIARFLGKAYSKFKKTTNLVKENIESAKKEVGFEQIKQEFNISVDEEETKTSQKNQKTTQIVDIYGETHHVMDVSTIRPDLSEKEIRDEIESLNEQNIPKDKEV
jgi:Sec-independent protein translocase protein TatA